MAEEEEAHSFEIRLALVGHVSVGKSTVINALLGDRFSEVSMRRTTAGINYFRVSQGGANPKNVPNGKEETTPSLLTPETTHAEISRDNERLRSGDTNESIGLDDDDSIVTNDDPASDAMLTKYFDVQVDEPICDMREDTKLVLIDIPGINEADSSKKYKDYVESIWDTFDCVVVVMDTSQGVNTQEQVELLKFVQRNNHEYKKIPTVVLGNKVDDPFDEDTHTLVEETRAKTIEIFGEGCSEKSLRSLLDAANEGKYFSLSSLPHSNSDDDGGEDVNTDGAVFIPVSAKNAFFYRKAVHLSVDSFSETSGNVDLFDKIGRDEVGRRWNKMSAEEKLEVIAGIIKDPDEYKERLAGTNFDNFLAVIKYFIGGKDSQKTLLAKQIELEIKALSSRHVSAAFVPDDDGKNPSPLKNTDVITERIHEVYKKCVAAGRSTDDLSNLFWGLYDYREETTFTMLRGSLEHPSVLETPFVELEKFYDLSSLLGWNEEKTKVKRRMKKFVYDLLTLVSSFADQWSFAEFYGNVRGIKAHDEKNSANGSRKRRKTLYKEAWVAPDHVCVQSLSPRDLMLILGSLLLSSCELEFYSRFGRQKLALEQFQFRILKEYADPLIYENGYESESEAGVYHYFQAILLQDGRECDDDVVFGDVEGAIYKISMPEDLSDPAHWGFIPWKYCSFCRRHDSV